MRRRKLLPCTKRSAVEVRDGPLRGKEVDNSVVKMGLRRIVSDVFKIELPSPLPFCKLQFYERQSLKYQSNIDVDRLILDAQSELAESAPEQFKIVLLGCMAGLRRREIDLLEWSSFKWEDNEIEVKRTKHFEAKSEDSYGSVQVDPELMSVFRGYRASAKVTDFVIKSDWEPTSAKWNRYRCHPHFEKLSGWLREKGIDDDKPLHVLRKEFGSRIDANGDIHAASRALRHADIGITAQFYLDSRKRGTTGFGHLFKDESTNIVEDVKFGTNAAWRANVHQSENRSDNTHATRKSSSRTTSLAWVSPDFPHWRSSLDPITVTRNKRFRYRGRLRVAAGLGDSEALRLRGQDDV